jgi:Raf kinase inhibitor-like YbhB/YbcL family protein
MTVAILGTLLKNRRAGEAQLAWSLPGLRGPERIGLTSPDFHHDGDIPKLHAGKRAGGLNRSPALTWTGVPDGTTQLLLVIEDIDAPTRSPFIHCVALLGPTRRALHAGALNRHAQADPGKGEVRILRSGMGRGYLGPEPIKGHGPHHYVFQLFALAAPLTAAEGGTSIDAAKPRAVLATVSGPVLARGRLDGRYER